MSLSPARPTGFVPASQPLARPPRAYSPAGLPARRPPPAHLAAFACEQPVVVAGHLVPTHGAQLIQVLVVRIVHARGVRLRREERVTAGGTRLADLGPAGWAPPRRGPPSPRPGLAAHWSALSSPHGDLAGAARASAFTDPVPPLVPRAPPAPPGGSSGLVCVAPDPAPSVRCAALRIRSSENKTPILRKRDGLCRGGDPGDPGQSGVLSVLGIDRGRRRQRQSLGETERWTERERELPPDAAQRSECPGAPETTKIRD